MWLRKHDCIYINTKVLAQRVDEITKFWLIFSAYFTIDKIDCLVQKLFCKYLILFIMGNNFNNELKFLF